MKFIALVILLFSSICHAESDVVVAQKNTMLVSYNTFQTTEGGERRVVEFSKPSIHHFFTYSNNQIFMNSVADKQKNLRQLRFTNNQFEIDAFSATKDTPLSWTLDNVKTVLAKSDAVIQQTPVEARSSRVLIEELPRGCGNVQVLGVLSDDKSHIKSYAVKVAGMGEMHINAHVEGVSCDDKTLVVGTLRCDSEKGPCYQNLVGVQVKDDRKVPSDTALLAMIYGRVDAKGKIITDELLEDPTYARVMMTRYTEIQKRHILYVITNTITDEGHYAYCNACASTLDLSVLEYKNGTWSLFESGISWQTSGVPQHTVYLDELGSASLGVIIASDESRQGEGTFYYSVNQINQDSVSSILTHSHYYGFNPMCDSDKRNFATLSFEKKHDPYDIKIKQNHYNEIYNCKERKYVNEEYLYRFSDNKYILIKANEIEHNLGY